MGARYVDRRCGYCNGKGKIEEGDIVPEKVLCPVCEGYGKVMVLSNCTTCPVCEGRGRKNVGESMPKVMRCHNCKGTGWAVPPKYR